MIWSISKWQTIDFKTWMYWHNFYALLYAIKKWKNNNTIKYLHIHPWKDGLPSSDHTPYFDHNKYFDCLKEYEFHDRNAQLIYEDMDVMTDFELHRFVQPYQVRDSYLWLV